MNHIFRSIEIYEISSDDGRCAELTTIQAWYLYNIIEPFVSQRSRLVLYAYSYGTTSHAFARFRRASMMRASRVQLLEAFHAHLRFHVWCGGKSILFLGFSEDVNLASFLLLAAVDSFHACVQKEISSQGSARAHACRVHDRCYERPPRDDNTRNPRKRGKL